MNSKNFIKINHALLELRFGKPLLLEVHNNSYFLFCASEVVTDPVIDFMKNISGSSPTITLTKERYNFFQEEKSNYDFISISYENLNSNLCHNLSFKSFLDTKFLRKFNIFPDKNPYIEKIFSLLYYGKLIPSIISCNVSFENKNQIYEKINSNNLFLLKEKDIEFFYKIKKEARLMVKTNVPLDICKNTKIFGFRPTDGSSDHFAFVFNSGEKVQTPLVRIHSQCITGDLFNSLKCDCGSQLNEAISILSKNNGILLYMSQEGRDIGFLNKLRAYSHQEDGLNTIEANNAIGFKSDHRNFEYASSILKTLNINSIRLLTNNPNKKNILEKDGIKVIEILPLKVKYSKEAKNYIEVKKKLLGHSL